MLGEALFITPQHKKAARAILKYIKELTGEKIVISISGESGSGKSGVAHEVAQLLKMEGTPAKVMHIDSYYKTSPRERSDWRKKHGVESVGYSEYDWEAIHRNLTEFQADADDVTMPCVDLLTDQEDELKTSFKGLRYILIEGLYAVQAEADLNVFLELTYHQTRKAQLLRGKENLDEWRLEVLEREHQVVRSLRPKANLIVTTEFDVVKVK